MKRFASSCGIGLIFFAVGLFGILLVTGCSSADMDKIDVYEMASFEETKPDSLKIITDREEINIIHKAFKGAKKNTGAADMADPHYKVDLGGRIYFLWIREDSGTIMNVGNTRTTYGLSKRSAGKVYGIITTLFGVYGSGIPPIRTVL